MHPRSRHPSPFGGPHELGQNLLVDRAVIDDIVAAVAATTGPILELGAGAGALTVPMDRLGRRLTAVELDPRLAAALDRRTSSRTTVVRGDLLAHPLPDGHRVVVGNLPFHLTTAVLRRLLAATGWTSAVLLVQWEVARKRSGVGGATMMTAQWWPWYEVALHSRVPAQAFSPRPSVDGGVLLVTRRALPLVGARRPYQDFVRRVFTGRGRGLPAMVSAAARGVDRGAVAGWMRRQHLPAAALLKDLDARQWAALWELAGDRRPGRR